METFNALAPALVGAVAAAYGFVWLWTFGKKVLR